MLTPKHLAIIAITIAAAAGFLAVEPLYFPSHAVTRASLAQGCNRPPGYISLILDDTGFNESRDLGQPILEVQKGATINIFICNLDPVQTHGFAIDHYFDEGVTLSPGSAYKVSFVADRAGAFTVYCNVFCTVHSYMLGRLVVA